MEGAMTEAMEMWAIVVLAFLGTVIWRALGVAVGDKIPPEVFFGMDQCCCLCHGFRRDDDDHFYPTGLMAETACLGVLLLFFQL